MKVRSVENASPSSSIPRGARNRQANVTTIECSSVALVASGILKDWLSRAPQLVLESRMERLDWPVMQRCSGERLFIVGWRSLRANGSRYRPGRDAKDASISVFPTTLGWT